MLSPKVNNSDKATQVIKVTFMLVDLLVKIPKPLSPNHPCASLTFKPSKYLTAKIVLILGCQHKFYCETGSFSSPNLNFLNHREFESLL